ncbi:MAG: phytanoyl-CoA dioxygenase family protein [Gammaproteobacteria bacterium AqS3]|nr:phytanoyl-CoA dioxygenase family protein [Gammaproteobacteria bacterium AqS3]
MAELITLNADADIKDVVRVLEQDGAVILRDVLSEAQVRQVEAELSPYWDATPPGMDDFQGTATTRTGALLARSEMCRQMTLHPAFIGACDALLLPYCQRYQVHLTQAIKIGPGETNQALHKDKWAWHQVMHGIEPMLSCMWAITDFTEDNGATRVAPGSMDWPSDRRAEPDELTCAAMSRGSMLLFSGSVLHSGGANNTDQVRIGVLLDCALGWLRQEENQYLCCPPEIAKDFDPALRRLLGYDMGAYTIGYYTPPLPPGSGLEAITPEYAVDPTVDTQIGQESELLEKKNAEVEAGAPGYGG